MPHRLERPCHAQRRDTVRRHSPDVPPGEPHLARGRAVVARYHVQQARLTRAVAADYADHLAFGHLDADALDRADGADRDRDPVQTDRGLADTGRARLRRGVRRDRRARLRAAQVGALDQIPEFRGGRRDLDDFPAVHQGDRLADREPGAHALLDGDQRGDLAGGDGPQHVGDAEDRGGREPERRLVNQQEPGIPCHRRGQRDLLTLAAAQGSRARLEAAAQHGEYLQHRLDRHRVAAVGRDRLAQVGTDAQVSEHLVLGGNQDDPTAHPARNRLLGDVGRAATPPLHPAAADPAAGFRREPADGVQQAALARAVPAKDDHGPALRHVQVHVHERGFPCAVRGVHAPHADQGVRRRGRRLPPGPRRRLPRPAGDGAGQPAHPDGQPPPGAAICDAARDEHQDQHADQGVKPGVDVGDVRLNPSPTRSRWRRPARARAG